ncbi:MAG: amidophosphoribosyltransferase [Candidatus Methanomethylophilaceae archaeon]|nr:amidophosphoribosyltransferase [Candidatus Methanomethylophilaceae archaeon]
MSGPEHSCGVVGISADFDVASAMHTALMIIQHRGQESAGLSTFNGQTIESVKGNGLVTVALPKEEVKGLLGHVGIGHVRYATAGNKSIAYAQPITVTTNFGPVAVAHDGEITNFAELKEKCMRGGSTFLTESDGELIIKLVAKYMNQCNDPVKAIRAVMGELDGSYALVVMVGGRLFGVRDPYGFKPLSIGKVDGGYMVVSETAAIDSLRGDFVRDVEPGEICEITRDMYKTYPNPVQHPRATCMFEWVYFARPDSVIDGVGVYEVRRNIGRVLARECPADVDFVMPVPDSGRAHAIGYACEAGIPYEEGFMKNRFADRTFIMPTQKEREFAVSMKMNPIKKTVEGKRIMIVDDSIVRGTTLKKLVAMLRKAGAREVHVRIGCPPVIAPCYYGVDMKTRDEFIANHYSVEEICGIIGADSLGYISYDGLIEAIGIREGDLCLACINGKYPTIIPGEVHRSQFQSTLNHDFQ